MIKFSRSSGILAHITSIPSKFGIGDLGPECYDFVNLLADLNQHFWSILPLHPTSIVYGNSPYQTDSAFAGNTLLISPELLAEDNLISKNIFSNFSWDDRRVDYEKVTEFKRSMIEEAFEKFSKSKGRKLNSSLDYYAFCEKNSYWLDDYALYKSLKEKIKKPWHKWPYEIRNREPQRLKKERERFEERIELEKFSQYVFLSQWISLKKHCKKKNIKIIGDLAFYVGYDSADVWSNSKFFQLDEKNKPKFIGGVPPDYFSDTGQRWDNPVYDWKMLKKKEYRWWINRIGNDLRLLDAMRLDHFRGFVAYWRIPWKSKTAKSGKWIRAPTKSFFEKVEKKFPEMPFIAEDLGYITEPVRRTKEKLRIPGMRVLVFAFDGKKDNPHIPRNYNKIAVVYTGTHDTNTVKGWFLNETDPKKKKRIEQYIGKSVDSENISRELIKIAISSKANLCIIPIQDVLCLGSEHRMNNPSVGKNNWTWRVRKDELDAQALGWMKQITSKFNRNSNL